MTLNKRQKGSIYEQKTADYLKEKGCDILEMNYRCRFGEIDVVAKDDQQLVFVEVKYRKTKHHGDPSESVTYHKKRHIIQVAKWYVMEHQLHGHPVRFDVATFKGEQLTYYKGAFDTHG